MPLTVICLALGIYAISAESILRSIAAVAVLTLTVSFWALDKGAPGTAGVTAWVIGVGCCLFLALTTMAVDVDPYARGRRRFRIPALIYGVVASGLGVTSAGILYHQEFGVEVASRPSPTALLCAAVLVIVVSIGFLIIVRRRT